MEYYILSLLSSVHAYSSSAEAAGTPYLVLTIILVIAAIALFVWVMNSEPDPKKPKPATSDSSDDRPHSSAKSETGKLNLMKLSPDEKKPLHDIVSLYSYHPGRDIWVCPDCETENSNVLKKCSACGCPHV